MMSLSELNSYSAGNVVFTVDTVVTTRVVGQSFVSPTPTWIPISQLGALTGNGVRVTYNVSSLANTTVAFNSVAESNHPLTVTNPSTGVYQIQGILDIIDYNAALATVNPPLAHAGNVNYTGTFINTNSSAGNFIVAFVGAV